MDRIDFDVFVSESGEIRIPPEYTTRLVKGEKIHVTVRTTTTKNKIVERMLKAPLRDPDFRPLTRNEIYEGR